MRHPWTCVLLLAGCASPPTLDEAKLVDLTYPFNDQTVYWPTARKFELEQVAYGRNADGDWYASNDFCASEHGGTHLDAPSHFAEGGRTTAEVPLAQLVGPARVIDIRRRCEVDPDYLLHPRDIERHEALYGPIEPGSIVLIRTGWSRFYPDTKRYLGSNAHGSARALSFPGIGAAAARRLVARGIDLVGIDTASLDRGLSTTFATHRVLSEANIPGLENVANLHKLPPRGSLVIALPMKIEGGTGGPCRIVAVLP